jgi:NADH dehydrogenase [ubiquinone] 1 alpha subcomplex assembly factor 5
MNSDSNLFNRALYRTRRNRAAKHWADYNFLKTEAAARLADKLDDVVRRFALALDVGCHAGEVAGAIEHKVDKVVCCDVSAAMQSDIVCDEESLPFAPESFDLVTSALALHHVNDLPGTLIQIRRCLKEDGLFLAVLPGANTLKELRASIMAVSAEQNFPLAPRLSPLVEIRDAGALLQRAGFALPVVDSEILTVEYDSVGKLFHDLRGMGEGNVLHAQHKGFTSRTQLAAIAAYYEQHFGENGVIPATFEFITLTGWKPHISQQQPAKRGSGQVNLKQVF